MNNRDDLRREYLQDALPTRLARLAADLQHIVLLTENPDSIAAVTELMNKCMRSIEWSAPDLMLDRINDAGYLVDVQRGLAHWQHIWHQAHTDPVQRRQLAEQAREWSIEILYMSGLVDE